MKWVRRWPVVAACGNIAMVAICDRPKSFEMLKIRLTQRLNQSPKVEKIRSQYCLTCHVFVSGTANAIVAGLRTRTQCRHQSYIIDKND